jgi:hypothetical protein
MLWVVYYGREFYDRSSTMFGSMYTEDGKRTDWGKIEIELEHGERVTIRGCTTIEFDALKDKLDRYIDEAAAGTNWISHPWVYGLGNLEVDGDGYKGWGGKHYSKEEVAEAVRKAKDF